VAGSLDNFGHATGAAVRPSGLGVKRPLTFGDGVGTGLAAAALLILLWLVSQISAYDHMYRDFGTTALPALTRVVLRPWWQFAVPTALLGLGLVALFTRVRFGMLAVALVTIAAILVTYQGLFAPITQLAGSIQ
jgi:hypothetical protein